jgi:hypothetical protein
MSIAPKLQQYLDEAKADYELIEHEPTKIVAGNRSQLPGAT